MKNRKKSLNIDSVIREATGRDLMQHIEDTCFSGGRPNIPTYGWLVCEFWTKNNPSAKDMTGQVYHISSEAEGHRLRNQVCNSRVRGDASAIIIPKKAMGDVLERQRMKHDLANTGVTWGNPIEC